MLAQFAHRKVFSGGGLLLLPRERVVARVDPRLGLTRLQFSAIIDRSMTHTHQHYSSIARNVSGRRVI